MKVVSINPEPEDRYQCVVGDLVVDREELDSSVSLYLVVEWLYGEELFKAINLKVNNGVENLHQDQYALFKGTVTLSQ